MKYLLSVIAFCLVVQISSAQQQNKNIIHTSEKGYTVGLYTKAFRFDRVENGVPNLLFWDWATCITMCLNYNGLNVLPEQVMTLVNGTVEEPIGNPEDLMFAINKNTPTAWGKPSKVYCTTANINADVLFDELSADRPIIIGLGSTGMVGRSLVVTAMAYTINFDAAGNQTGITPTTVTLRDPWPNGGFTNRTINWTDFVGITASLYTIKVEFKK